MNKRFSSLNDSFYVIKENNIFAVTIDSSNVHKHVAVLSNPCRFQRQSVAATKFSNSRKTAFIVS